MNAQEIKSVLDAQFGDAILGGDLETASPFILCEVAKWHDIAVFCQNDENLKFDSLMNHAATDMGDTVEVIIH